MRIHWSRCPQYALALSLAALLSPAAGWAAGETSTATGSAKARLIQPLAIAGDGVINFGTLIKNAMAAPVTITLDPRVSQLPSIASSNPAAVTPLSGHGDASFLVTGEPGSSVQVTVPASIIIKKGQGGTAATEMTVDAFNVDVWDTPGTDLHNDATGQFTIPADGSAKLEIGGTLTIDPSDELGAYEGTFNVTVSYV